MDLKKEVSNLVADNYSLAKQLAREKLLRVWSVESSAEKYKNLEQDLEKAIETLTRHRNPNPHGNPNPYPYPFPAHP